VVDLSLIFNSDKFSTIKLIINEIKIYKNTSSRLMNKDKSLYNGTVMHYKFNAKSQAPNKAKH